MPDTDYTRIEKIIHYLDTNFRAQPALKDIADYAGLSEYHLQRLFKRWAGISPKRFIQYLTAQYAKERLQQAQSVLDVAYEAGLTGGGRLHDLMVNVHAMTPGEIKAQGAGLTIRYGFQATPFGECLLAVTERGICALSFVASGGRDGALLRLHDQWALARCVEDGGKTRLIVEQIFSGGSDKRFNLLLKGTNFQVKVWEALVKIPPGALVSYGDVARLAGIPDAARAVGSAVGQNPVAYLIPCHRVIRKTGAFSEYRWGIARKKAMIAWDAARCDG
ncbi:MAG: methylated-DNA--[protein]-cysteine S-methyltransferase [Anaerolineae bacterium]|nr:methylated-DNA--[protein]-cysteine S-methyltransferase [Anaerolineae bacterium]